MNFFENMRISSQNIIDENSEIQAQIQQHLREIDEKRNEQIINVAKSIPNIMTDVPEEDRLVILIDIVGFSRSTTREQVYKIYLFQRYLIGRVLTNKVSLNKKINISQFIPTGDGCYIVADKCEPAAAIDFLVTLISGFKEISEGSDESRQLSLRASALIGSCVPFMDLQHHKNYIGEGMNEAARILSCGQSELEKDFLEKNKDKQITDAKMYSRNSLYVGDTLAAALKDFEDKGTEYFRFNNVSDKHGKTRNITILQGIL